MRKNSRLKQFVVLSKRSWRGLCGFLTRARAHSIGHPSKLLALDIGLSRNREKPRTNVSVGSIDSRRLAVDRDTRLHCSRKFHEKHCATYRNRQCGNSHDLFWFQHISERASSCQSDIGSVLEFSCHSTICSPRAK